MSRIFISYRRQDSEAYVDRLHDHLTQHFPPDDVFLDVDTIPPGADFVQFLEDSVAGCDVFLAIIGPDWLTVTDAGGQQRLFLWNDFVRVEIASALRLGKLVIPVLVGGAGMPKPAALPDDLQALSRRNAVELGRRSFSADVARLVEAIRAALPVRGIKASASPEVLAEKAEKLKALRLKLAGATDSPLYTFRNENRLLPVLGDGNPDAQFFFIGEAPGKSEAESGQPFVGPSGEVLDQMLASIDLKREDVFVTNLVLDRPATKDPTPEELAYYEQFADAMLDIIQPGVIVTLGRFAMSYMLKKLDLPEKRQKISQLHGKPIKAQLSYGEIHLVPLYHPAVVLYSATQRATLERDFQMLKQFI